MQIPFRQTRCPSFSWLARLLSPVSRHLPDSLYTSTAVAAGLLWLALFGL